MVRDPYAHLGDEHFPFVSGQGAGDRPLIDLPHRGNAIHVRCFSCGREAEFSGRRLAIDFTARLAFSISRFVAALRCSGCSGKRLVGFVTRDPAGNGFQNSTQEVGHVIWARRLNTWLAEAGSDIRDFREVLSDVPCDAALAAAGIVPRGNDPG